MLRNLFLLALFCLLSIGSFGHSVDTTILGVRYTMIEDVNSKEKSFIIKIENLSKEVLKTMPLGVNVNNIVVYNSKNQKVGYDFIVCGDFEQVIVQPDSSTSWQFVALDQVPMVNAFVARPSKAIQLDSMYFLYWQINGHSIGPIEYYIEKDLVTRLYEPDNQKRDPAAETLQRMKRLNLNTVKKGHVYEHTATFWRSKLNQLKAGMSLAEVNDFLGRDGKPNDLYLRPVVHVQLDNAYYAEFTFNEKQNYKNYHLSKSLIKVEVEIPENYSGRFRTYYIDGTLKADAFYAHGLKEGKHAAYMKNGALSYRTYYSKGLLKRKTTYYNSGELMHEIIYKKGKPRRKKSYKKDGTLVANQKYKRGKVKRIYL